ncbi:MAG: UvrD-helicase domain-containing protein, partial [Ardenticatenales bacterium]
MNPLLPYDLPLDGAHLIEASAGTGKTFTIATLVLRLVLEAGRTIDEILVVTFTRAATAELRDRIRRRLAEALALCSSSTPPDADPTGLAAHLARRRAAGHGPADLQALTAALRSFDTAPIFTIHGFCQRVLQEFAFESGMSFEATLAEDSLALQREIVADYWATRTYAAPRSLVDYLIHQANVTPTTLDALADAAARARGIELTPAPSSGDAAIDPADLDASVVAWQAARAAVAARLDAGRTEAEAILSHSPALRHGSYTRTNVPRWLDQVDAWARGHATPPSEDAIREKWVRFTSDAVDAATKDGHATPHHPLFDAIDRLRDVDDVVSEAMARWAEGVRLGLLPYLRRETDVRRRRANAQTFDDLLHDLA